MEAAKSKMGLLVAHMAAAAMLAVVVLLAFAAPSPAYAAAYQAGSTQASVQVGGYSYSAEWTRNQESDKLYNIVAYSPSGSWNRKTLVRDADERFVVNDKYLFYAKRVGKPNYYGLYKQAIYRLDMKSGKKKKLVTGPDYVPFACSGKYLYCGRKFSSINKGTLYVLKAKSGKVVKKLGNHLTEATYSGGRVLAIKTRMQVGNYPIRSFSKSGKGKKTIAKGMYFKAQGKTVYYAKYRKGGDGLPEYQVRCCTVKGKSQKTLTGWTSNRSVLARYGL